MKTTDHKVLGVDVRYGSLGSHPIIPVPESEWLIIDSVWPSWWHLENGYDPEMALWLGIHLDKDDPTFDFEKNKHRPAFCNLHRKEIRLKKRRSTIFQELEAYFIEEDYRLFELIKKYKGKQSFIFDGFRTIIGYTRMSIYKVLKEEHIDARKSKFAIADFIGYVISEIEKGSVTIVDGNKTYPDDKVIAVIKNLVKKLEDPKEVAFLSGYLPAQLDENAIREILLNSGAEDLGGRMAFLKANFAGQYDGKLASEVARSL